MLFNLFMRTQKQFQTNKQEKKNDLKQQPSRKRAAFPTTNQSPSVPPHLEFSLPILQTCTPCPEHIHKELSAICNAHSTRSPLSSARYQQNIQKRECEKSPTELKNSNSPNNNNDCLSFWLSQLTISILPLHLSRELLKVIAQVGHKGTRAVPRHTDSCTPPHYWDPQFACLLW